MNTQWQGHAVSEALKTTAVQNVVSADPQNVGESIPTLFYLFAYGLFIYLFAYGLFNKRYQDLRLHNFK